MTSGENIPKEVPLLQAGKRQRGRPKTHGLYSKFTLTTLTDKWRGEVVKAIESQGTKVAVGDDFLIDMLARLLAQTELMGRWLAEHGLFQDDASGESRGAVSPLVQEIRHSIKAASQICTQLGLSPVSRQRLQAPQKEDLASKIQRLKQE